MELLQKETYQSPTSLIVEIGHKCPLCTSNLAPVDLFFDPDDYLDGGDPFAIL